jgi:anthranilate phosphoribosyltransferase
MKNYIQKLVDGDGLTRDDAYQAIAIIMRGEATEAQIASFLTALRLRGETPDVISGATRAMREVFTPIPTRHVDAVDTCGTGGDGLHTFNISTTAAFVTAGAGVPVAKHGNRSVSSISGSADVLKELGVNITATPACMSRCLDEIGIAFLFAPSLHPAMKHAIGPRREIGIRTLFNILGPLSNPASTRRGVLGVYNAALVDLVANALADLGTEHLFVVHGEDGLDEITTTAATQIGEVRNGAVTRYTLTPEEFGLPWAQMEDLRGGDPAQNAAITRAILAGEQGPRRDIVLLNAAAAICAGGKAASLKEGLLAASHSIDSGQAQAKLSALATITTASAI